MPGVVRGPDLWATFKDQTSLFNSDGLHPNDAGIAAYRKAWANAMVKAVY
jgi:hypothetical protein